MARGGKRAGAGRKPSTDRKAVGGRVAILVRVNKDVEQRIEQERGGRSLSSTIENLLRGALGMPCPYCHGGTSRTQKVSEADCP